MPPTGITSTSTWAYGRSADQGADGRFLRRVRDGACASFNAVLGPDYNAAH
ncbi:extensin family protein, partial [Pseudomonas aeruginosa]